MKGLLLKEWYSGKKYCLMLTLSMFVFCGVTILSRDEVFVLFTGYIGGLIPVTFLSLDDQSKWTSYGNIFPYSRKDFVNVKYMLSLLMMLIVAVLICVSTAIIPMLTGGFNKNIFYLAFSIVLAINAIVPAINLPLFFKYGSEKGRIIYYIVVFISSGSLGAIANIVSDSYTFPFDTFTVFIIILAVSAVSFVFSWILSVRFYEGRDL